VAEVALRTAGALAAQPERPAYVKVAEPPRPISGGGGTGYGPWFGSIPDMGEEVEGVRFGGVMEGSPAAKAGLLPGDLLVEFAGKPIKNLYDFTYALRQQKVGDEIAVVVVRGKERLTVQVTLTARR
jgi:S1-C subfamily serine protease